MDERGQFTFYRSFWEAVKGLPKKDRLPILEAIISYALDGIEPSGLSQSQLAFFLLVKPTLDSARKKAASGKQGGKTLKANDKQTGSKPEANRKQTGSKPEANRKQTGSKSEANDKQTASEKEKEKEKEKENENENEIEIEIEGEKEKDKEQTASAPLAGKQFTLFWEAYPKKIDREAAWSAWKSLHISPDTAQQILSALEQWKKSSQWTEDGDRFVPNASKFLSKGHWMCPPTIGTGKKKNAVPMGCSELGEAELENIRRLMEEYQT